MVRQSNCLLITRYLANGPQRPNFYSRLGKKDRAGPESAHRLRAWPETLGKPARLSVWQATQILVSYQHSNLKAGAVQGERRNYYLLSVIDVYSRKILDWLFQGSIRQVDLINLFRRINRSHELKGVILRNDNGSQQETAR